MNALAIDIKDMITDDSSLGYTFGTDLFISRMPNSPNNCITLYDISGASPDIGLQKEIYYRDGVQFVVRNNSYVEAMAAAWDIIESLQGRAGEIWNDVYYALILTMMTPSILGYDQSNRIEIVFSLEAQRR